MKTGQHVTDVTRARMSAAHKGEKKSPEACAKVSAWHMGRPPGNKGVPMSAEARAKMSTAHKGKKLPPETCAHMSAAALGHAKSLETRAKMSVAKTGPLHWGWKGGKQVSHKKRMAKRRSLGFIPLNEPFPCCDAHHVDHDHILYIPSVLHQSVRHNVWTGRNMDAINAIARQYLMEAQP